MPQVTDQVKERIIADISAGKLTLTGIANKHKVSRGTVYRINKSMEDVDIEDLRLRRKVKDQTATLRSLQKLVLDLQRKIDTYEQFDAVRQLIVPMNFSIRRSKSKHEAVPVLNLTDWHIDELVKAASMWNYNHYDVAEARLRVKKLFNHAGNILTIYKYNSDIDTLVVHAGGDFFSGWIHEELAETNTLAPTEALLEALDMLIGGLDHLLATGAVSRIVVVCSVGNHGRITRRMQHKNRAETNYEWLLYQFLMRHYLDQGETRITFRPPCGYFNWLDILGYPTRFHHGDNIKYNGGVGGVHIPLNKAIAKWNKKKVAAFDVMGHWHTTMWGREYAINGSVIGYNEFAESIKADPEPAQQSMFLVHKKYGVTGLYPIKLQKLPE